MQQNLEQTKLKILFYLDCWTKNRLSTMSTGTKIIKSGNEPPTSLELDVAQVRLLFRKSKIKFIDLNSSI